MSNPSARRPTTSTLTSTLTSPVMGTAVRALGVVVLVLAAGCSSTEKKAAPPAQPTPIQSLNTNTLEVPRIEFCSLVPAKAVSDALGGKASDHASYGNGDKIDLAGVGTDVVHEIGCTWDRGDDSTARAWVFAQPVDRALARAVVAEANANKSCRTEPGTPFGSPSLTQTCTLPGGQQRVRHAGLFGQTWLTCEVARPTGDPGVVRERSDEWCVQVLNSLNTAR